jgi:hypothetical protein
MARKSNDRDAGRAAGADDRIEGFAEDLGRLLGSAQNKAESWLSQRSDIAKHLENVRDTAVTLLNQLGVPGGAPRGRSSGRKVKRGARRTKRKRTMSPEARERIAAAQRKRWAKVRKAKGE